jgi:hypothetical protein
MAQNIFLKSPLKFPFSQLYKKLLLIEEGFLLAGFYRLRSHLALRLKFYVTFGSKMKKIKMPLANSVNHTSE